jgi:hypothetical protein
MHEAQMHTSNCFITLTYAPEHCPKDMSLHYDHFQKFMKKLRKHYEYRNIYDFRVKYRKDGKPYREKYIVNPIRFYMAGEYGETFDRPHFHACIFGLDFEDKKFFQRTQTGSILYTSKILEKLWTYGYSSIGDVNFESAAYVARYIMKKINGKTVNENHEVVDAEAHYQYCDLNTGEIIQRKPEFNKMSLRPGIGQAWFDKFMSDVYTTDSVVVRGKKCRPPRFYDNKFKELFPEEFDGIQYKRELDGRSRSEDNTLERLAVKEKVALAKLSLLKRKL